MDFNVSKNTSQCQSFQLRVRLNRLSIRRLLQQQLLESVTLLSEQSWNITGWEHRLAELISDKIPLCRLKNHTGVVYRCAIAFGLASVQKLSPEAIAHQLVTFLPTIASNLNNQPLLDFTVRVVNPGWIDFELSDRALAVWLQQLPQITSVHPPSSEVGSREESFEFVSNLFPIQYAHARCCSLLRLGHREGLIGLHDQDFSQPVWQWVEPNPIPWFNPHPEHGNFQLVHPTERHLILQLLAVIEALDSSEEGNWVKLAADLSKAMLDFYRSCRIWGEIKKETPALAQARLGLIAVTQFLLRGLMQEQIRVSAPVEL
ncbi:MAG: DALR anticodon-binding domain-containing protein [Xenococcaceae cyanobacterium]